MKINTYNTKRNIKINMKRNMNINMSNIKKFQFLAFRDEDTSVRVVLKTAHFAKVGSPLYYYYHNMYATRVFTCYSSPYMFSTCAM